MHHWQAAIQEYKARMLNSDNTRNIELEYTTACANMCLCVSWSTFLYIKKPVE